MSTSKEYKAVRNCILNELHLTKEDIIKNIEPELWISLDVITNYLPNIKQNHLSQ